MAKDRSIPKQWEEFMKEAEHAIKTGEDLADFVERMKDHGFQVSYNKRNLSQEENDCQEVIRYFNKMCDTTYEALANSVIGKLIITRYREGHSAEIMKRVIDMMAARFKGGALQTNLRPDIIFNRLRFSAYVGQLPAMRRPAVSTPAPARTADQEKAKVNTSPAPPKKSEQEIAEDETHLMHSWIEEISCIDQSKQNILIWTIPINIVWKFLERTKKQEINNAGVLVKAKQFAAQKINEYKQQSELPNIDDRIETCRRYYIIKSLFKGHSLGELKAWAQPHHFKNIPQ